MNEEALGLVKRVLVSHGEAPLEEMTRLVALAAADGELRAELLEGAAEVLIADPDSLVPCWLALIAGELGPAAAEVLLSALGTSEGEALDETIVPILARHAESWREAITAARSAVAPDDEDYRASLDRVLSGEALPEEWPQTAQRIAARFGSTVSSAS